MCRYRVCGPLCTCQACFQRGPGFPGISKGWVEKFGGRLFFPKIKLKIPGFPLGSHASLSILRIHPLNQAPKTLAMEMIHESSFWVKESSGGRKRRGDTVTSAWYHPSLADKSRKGPHTLMLPSEAREGPPETPILPHQGPFKAEIWPSPHDWTARENCC